MDTDNYSWVMNRHDANHELRIRVLLALLMLIRAVRYRPVRLFYSLVVPVGVVALSLSVLLADRRDALLALSLDEAVAELTRRFGPDPANWKYGQTGFHHALIRHPMSDAVNAATRAKLDVGPLPRGGDGMTINATGNSDNQTNDNGISALPSDFAINLPAVAELEIVETAPIMKTATKTASTKPAKLSNGVTIQVPEFIGEGERVRVDPRSGTYLERAK